MTLYYSFLEQEHDIRSELWIRRDGNLYPVFDYKIINDEIRLISDPEMNVVQGVTLAELIEYVDEEGNTELIPYRIIDELTGQNLDIKDRFSTKLIFELCN